MISFLQKSLLSNGAVGLVLGDSAPVDVVMGCQGYAFDLARGTTTAVAGSDVRQNAVRYTQSGVLRMYDASGGLPAGAVIVDGLAVSSDGQLCYTTATPSSPSYIGGMAVASNGAVYAVDLTPTARYIAGRDVTLSGSDVVDWGDVSGNSRDLVQGTGANRPTYQSDGSILFNGTDEWLATGTFTLNQPFTVIFVGKQITWTSNDIIFDGFTYQSAMLAQGGVSPQVFPFAGSVGAVNGNWALDTTAVIQTVFNGASSLTSVNGTDVAASVGAQNAAGFTLGAGGAGTGNFSNVQIWEVVILAGAASSTVRGYFDAYFKAKYGL